MGCFCSKIIEIPVGYTAKEVISGYLKKKHAERYKNMCLCEYMQKFRDEPDISVFKVAVVQGGYIYHKVGDFIF